MASRRPWLMALLFGGSTLTLIAVVVGTWFLRYGHERVPSVVIQYSPFVDQVNRAYMVVYAKSWTLHGASAAHHFPVERYTRLVGPLTGESFRAALYVGLRAAGSDTHPSDPAAVAAIKRWVEDERWWVRHWWMTMIGSGNPELRSLMTGLLADPHPVVVGSAAIGLMQRDIRTIADEAHVVDALRRAMAYGVVPLQNITTLRVITSGHLSGAADLMQELTAVDTFVEETMSQVEIAAQVEQVRIAAFTALLHWNSDVAEEMALDAWESWTAQQRTEGLRQFRFRSKLPWRLIDRVMASSDDGHEDETLSILLIHATDAHYPSLRAIYGRHDPSDAQEIGSQALSCWIRLGDLIDQPRFATQWSEAMRRHCDRFGTIRIRSTLRDIPETLARKLVLALDDRERDIFKDIIPTHE